MRIKPLPAYHGDSILVSFADQNINRNILIDTGPSKTYGKTDRPLNKEINKIEEHREHIDLLVITHIDDDHIAGGLKMFGDTNFDATLIKKVWFNSGELIATHFNEESENSRELKLPRSGLLPLSVSQGVSLENTLKAYGLMSPQIVMSGHEEELGNAKIRVLSPQESGLKELHQKWEHEKSGLMKIAAGHQDFSKSISELAARKFEEDSSVPNGSSLSLLIEVNGKSALLLGDAHPSSVESSLKEMGYSEERKLEVDIVKLSHHGSRKNTSPELLKLIECEKYIVSTDGSRHGLPDKESLARVIHNNKDRKTQFFFNFSNRVTNKIFLTEDQEMYSFEIFFIDPASGILL
jgi:beta-lactamase superfamily II metal-dependent hydrolase